MADVNRQTEEMLSPDDMMLDSEPVTNEQLVEAGKDLGQFALESTPIVGEAIIAKDIGENISEGDYLSAGLNTAALGVGALPVVGDMLNRPLRAAAKNFSKADVSSAKKLMDDDAAATVWKEKNKLPESQRQKRVPEVQDAAKQLSEGKITSKEYRRIVKANQPIKPITLENFPEMPTKTDIVGALKATDPRKVDTGIIGVNKTIPDGTRVGSRLDIPSYDGYDKWIVSLHDGTKRGGESIGYGQSAVLKNVEFVSSAKGGLNIAKDKNKATIARIHGDYYNAEPENVFEAAKTLINDPEWTQIGMNPFRHSFFYNKATGNPVTRADEVIQVGPLVLAKGLKKPTISELKELKVKTSDGKTRMFNEGGMSIEKQMEMFEDGGLMQEGGTVDPVSGNDVPVGSTQEEVRDDIPAQLSEGEFVFPADVVRFYGLEKLMEMRQRAKAGLRMMEDMGQMGNSEEATLPDDIPFDLEDLDMEYEPEYNDTMEMQVGGFVQPQGFTGIQTMRPSVFQNYQPQYVPYQAPTVPTTYQPVQQQAVPTFTGQVPQAQDFLKTPQPGEQDLRKYVNAEGQVRMIPFVNDQPIYPIPQGFYPEAEKPVEEPAPTAVTTETTRVTDRGGRDDNVTVGGRTTTEIQQGISEVKDRFAITGSRGLDILSLLPGGNVIKNMFGVQGPVIGKKEFGNVTGPKDQLRMEYEKVLGTGITGYVGYEKGDLDPVTGGVFDLRGRAVNEDGSAALNDLGTRSYSSAKDWANDMKAGQESGWKGGPISQAKYNSLTSVAQNRYDKYAEITGANSYKSTTPTTTPTTTLSTPSGDSGDRPDRSGGGPVGGGVSSDVRGAVERAGGYTGGGRFGGFAKGGAATKKMKQGGLASKK